MAHSINGAFKAHPRYPHILVSSTGIIKIDVAYYNSFVAPTSAYFLRKDTPKIGFHKEGYLTVSITLLPKKHKHFLVHTLVADTYCPRKFSDEPLYVNHIDGKKHNNNASNLEWVTMLENNMHFITQLRTEAQRGCMHDKRTVFQYDLDGRLVAEYSTLSQLSKKFSIGLISQICNNLVPLKLYKGYLWSYEQISDAWAAIQSNLNQIFRGNWTGSNGVYYCKISRGDVHHKLGPYASSSEAKNAFITKWLELYRNEFYSDKEPQCEK